jgi:hypothetical protein
VTEARSSLGTYLSQLVLSDFQSDSHRTPGRINDPCGSDSANRKRYLDITPEPAGCRGGGLRTNSNQQAVTARPLGGTKLPSAAAHALTTLLSLTEVDVACINSKWSFNLSPGAAEPIPRQPQSRTP